VLIRGRPAWPDLTAACHELAFARWVQVDTAQLAVLGQRVDHALCHVSIARRRREDLVVVLMQAAIELGNVLAPGKDAEIIERRTLPTLISS